MFEDLLHKSLHKSEDENCDDDCDETNPPDTAPTVSTYSISPSASSSYNPSDNGTLETSSSPTPFPTTYEAHVCPEDNNRALPSHLSYDEFSSIRSSSFDDGFKSKESKSSFIKKKEKIWETKVMESWVGIEKPKRRILQQSSSDHNKEGFLICNDRKINEKLSYEFKHYIENEIGLDNTKTSVEMYPILNSIDMTCYYATLDVCEAKKIMFDGVTVTPQIPEIKIRANTASLSNQEDYKAIKIVITILPGLFSSDTDALDYAVEFTTFLEETYSTSCAKYFEDISISTMHMENNYVLIFESSLENIDNLDCYSLLIETLSLERNVLSIEKLQSVHMLDSISNWIVESGVQDSNPWYDKGIKGKGQVIQISDDGLDLNHCYFRDDSADQLLFGVSFAFSMINC